MSDVPQAEKDPRSGLKTARFVVLMLSVLGGFTWLSMLKGPPMMPVDKTHQEAFQARDEDGCLKCHALAGTEVPTGAKVLGPDHPPPRPRKARSVLSDAGFMETPPGPAWECIKCHVPR
jgi:nitrate reductase cytochrome c-type subunit